MSFKSSRSRPSAERAARRLIVLGYVVAYALSAPPRDELDALILQWSEEERRKLAREGESRRDRFWLGLRGLGLWSELTPGERELARTTIVTMTDRQQADASWRIEALQALMWALGMLSQLPPYDTMADHELLERVPVRPPADFWRGAQLRPQSEIERARDAAELWHWRSRTRRLIEAGDRLPEGVRAAGFGSHDEIVRFTARRAQEDGSIPTCLDDDFPAKGKAYRDLTEEEWREVTSIAAERHLALNWLCGYAPGNRWDETPTET